MLPGVLADFYVQVVEQPKAKVVPFKAVQKDENGDYVYVVEQNVAKKRYVEIKEQNQKMVSVDGLMSGESLLIAGYNMVYDNCKVKVVE